LEVLFEEKTEKLTVISIFVNKPIYNHSR